MKKIIVNVTQTVEITIDGDSINQEFMDIFKTHFHEFETIEEHAKHLAQMEARSLIGYDKFVEGYGDLRKMGITAKITEQHEEIEESTEE